MNEDMGKHGIVHSVREQFKTVKHKADVCVVGAGLAGMCAAIAAARRGCSVVLVHDRPMPGGNCSSEIRMWPLGADGSNPANLRETGIFEELLLENMYRNPTRSFAIWDSVLYGAVRYQSGLKLILNCSVNAARTHDARIVSVSGWQLTTYFNHEIEANIFIDCSGDSVLATLSGAKFRRGREAAGEFGESIEPETADSMTMGNTCLIQARETAQDIRYTPARWAEKIDKSQLEGRGFKPSGLDGNYWWMELGGERDTISDSEEIRDELIALSYGVWDYVKNSGDGDAVKKIKEVERKRIKEYLNYHKDAVYTEGCFGIWSIKCDIALPCATQNEIDEQAAKTLVANGCYAVGEGANMPSTLEATKVFLENGVLFAPAKAANAGGVATSALEMSQNSMRYSWSFEEVDAKLHDIMKNIYKNASSAAAEYGMKGNLVAGANIAGFTKVAEAMLAHGIV